MPRRYHRPPQAKKRKARKTRIPYAFEDPEAVAEAGDGGLPVTEDQEGETAAREPLPAQPPQVSEAAPAVAHIGRDYSYVKAEVVRILLVAGFLLLSLIITAILRH